MKMRKNPAKIIAGGIVLTALCLCSFAAHGAIMIENPDKDETPVSIGKTIGQVTTTLLGDAKKNIYFNKEAFPAGSANTWAQLGDRLITFVKNYQPEKLSSQDQLFINDAAKNFKNYGTELINVIKTIKNVYAYSAIQNKIVTYELQEKITEQLTSAKKISNITKNMLNTLTTRMKKHKSALPQPTTKLVQGQNIPSVRVPLSKIEEKLHNAYTSLDVVVDRILRDAKPQIFTAGLAQYLHPK